MIPPMKPGAHLLAIVEKEGPTQQRFERFRDGIKISIAASESRKERLERNKDAYRRRAQAEALGEPFSEIVLSPAEMAILESEIQGQEEAAAFFRTQLPGAAAAKEKIDSEMRTALGRQLNNEVIPPLLEAAQASCAAAVRDLAALAAVEDRIINRLQARPPVEYVPGNAACFLTGMINSGATNVFCDFGSGRGAWDVPGYSEHSTATEKAVRALEAAAREPLA